MATTFDRHYLQPVLSQQQAGSSHQRYQAGSREHQTNGSSPFSLPAMSPSTQTPSNSQTSNTPVEPNMADEVSGAAVQNASPAKAGRVAKPKGRGGRPPAKGNKAKVTKTASNAKQGTGRGRRQKVYDYLKAQAAHERMAELKSNFTQLARAMKPALNELADRTLAKLTSNPTAHEEVPEAREAHQFLDQRLADTIATADLEHKMNIQNATHLFEVNTRLAREQCTEKILEAECEMYDGLLAKLDCLEHLHDNNLPVDLPDVTYQYKDITQEQVDQQGPYVHHNDNGVPVPCSERIVALSQIMNDSYQFADEHRGKRKAEEEPEGPPDAKRQALLGLDDDVPRRTSALMSAHDDVAEGGRSATPGEEQQDTTRKTTKVARAKAGAKGVGLGGEEKDEELVDVEEVNGLPLPKGASRPDQYGVRIITKSRKVEYANNRIMAPVASPFDDFQIGYRDSSNNPMKGATKARRRHYLDGPNSNAAFYDRRVANYNSVLQSAEDYDKDIVEKHKLHPSLGIFMPDSVNDREYPGRKGMSEYNPVVQVGPKGQIFHASRSVHRYRLDRQAEKIESRLRLKSALPIFMAQEGIAEEEVAPEKEVVQQHREEVLVTRAIDPSTLPIPRAMPSPSPSPEAAQPEEPEVTVDFHSVIGELLQAAEQVESEEDVGKMFNNTAAHKSSRPYDAIRDVFTEKAVEVRNAPTTAPERAAEPTTTYNLSFLAEVAENPERAERMRREELRWAEIRRNEEVINQMERQQAAAAGGFRDERALPGPAPVEISVMDPRLFPSHDVPHGSTQAAAAQVPPPQHAGYPPPDQQYYQHHPAAQWPSQQPPMLHTAPPARGNDFLRTALNPQTPPPPPPGYAHPTYPPPPDYQGGLVGSAQMPANAAPRGGSLPALRPVRTSFDDGSTPPEYQGSPGPAHRMVASNSGAYYPPPPPRPYHNGYMVEEQHLPPHQHAGPPHYHQSMHPMMAQSSYPQSPDSNGYPYPPLAPAPGGVAYHQTAPYNPIASHPMTPGPMAPRPQPGSSSRPYRKLEPAPAQSATKPRGKAQRPELRTVQFDYREGIKDYVPLEAPPVHGPSSIRGWSHQNLKQRRPSKEVPAAATPARSDNNEPS